MPKRLKLYPQRRVTVARVRPAYVARWPIMPLPEVAEVSPGPVLRNDPSPMPRASTIDPAYPVFGTPTTASVRGNFQAAKDEIEDLQDGKLDLAGGTMTGEIEFTPAQRVDGGSF